MYIIKITDDPRTPQDREALLFDTACSFRPDLNETPLVLCRTEKGKPYLVYETTGKPVSDLEFSISHSEKVWGCIVSDCTCGLDIQKIRPADHESLAERFFSQNESQYVKSAGIRGFYEIWTRREALAKYTGLGFFGMSGSRPELVEPDSDAAGISEPSPRLSETVVWNGKTVVFEEIKVPEGFVAVWCHEKGGKEL